MIIQSLIENGKEVKLKGVNVVYADIPGRNDKIYPEKVLKEAVKHWKKFSDIDNSYRFIFARHPKEAFGDENDYIFLAGIIDDLWYDEKEKSVKANVTLLKTTFGQLIKYLIDKNIRVGVSIRGKAKFSPKVIELNSNGTKKLRTVKVAEKLLLTGFDFVTFPSFIITGASKENVAEKIQEDITQLINEFIEEYKVQDKHILCKMFGLCELHNIKEKTLSKENNLYKEEKMVNKDLNEVVELLNVKKEKLELEIDKLKMEKDNIEKELATLKTEKDKYSEEVNELRKKYDALSSMIREYTNQLNILKEQIESMKDTFEKVKRKVVVEYKGKTFDEDNPPKIRIVGPDEKVGKTPWGEIDKLVLRKLCWLTKKASIVKECFGVVEDDWREDYRSLKYPHHELVPSDSDEYDFDMVLNYDGLRTAYVFMMGKPGWSLSPQERRKLAKHLLKHYRQLKKAGYDVEIPEPLKNIAESAVIVKDEDEILGNIFDKLIEKGIIKFENTTEDIDEFKVINVSDDTVDYILSKIAKAFTYISEKTASDDLVNIIGTPYNTWKQNINKNDVFNYVKEIFNPDSQVSKLIGTNDYGVGILQGIIGKLNGEIGDKINGIERLKSIAVVGALDRVDTEYIDYDFDDIETVIYLVNKIINYLMYCIEHIDEYSAYVGSSQSAQPYENKQAENIPENKPTETMPENKPEAPQSNENQVNETIFEKTLNKEDKMYKEKIDKIINILHNNVEYEGDITIENIEDVIEKIVISFASLTEKYEEAMEKIKEIELMNYKNERKKELVKEGISPSVIDDAFEKAKSIEDVDVIADILMKSDNTKVYPRKGNVNVDAEDNDDKFSKIFKRI